MATRRNTDRRRVAVVYGRDLEARNAIFGFLRTLGLHPIEWEQAISRGGQVAPFNLQVVKSLLNSVQAVVVLMTPDDEGRLRASLRSEHESPWESELSGRPRQNVAVEAGMALALFPSSTILVEIGDVQRPSDLQGINTVNIDHTSGPLKALATRLRRAGCLVDERGLDYLDTQRFVPILERIRADQEEQFDPLTFDRDVQVPLRRAMEMVGLVDVENRRKDKRNVPPTTFYARAKREIAISALSARMTFEMHTQFFTERVRDGIHICILLLHPDSPDVAKLEGKVNQAIRADILTSVDFIKRHFRTRKEFEVRFASELAPFTAAMIDGDIRSTDRRTRTNAGGVIRIQPGVVHERPHHGLILQLAEIPDGMFHYFAKDLCAQWEAAIEEPSLFRA